MKKHFFILACMLQFTVFANAILADPADGPSPDKVFIRLHAPGIMVSLSDFIKLDAKEYSRLTGKKLSVIEKIVLKINQKRYRRCIRQDGTVNMVKFGKLTREPYRFNTGGFILGFVAWVPGLIAALIVDSGKKPKNFFISALIGCLLSPWSFILYIGLLIKPA